MYLQQLMEDTDKQQGARFYPDDNSESYIVIRRAGTLAHRKAEAEINAKYPPAELLKKDAQHEQQYEKAIEAIRDYFVADMVGFKNVADDSAIDYKSQKHLIFSNASSDETISLVNLILSFAGNYKNYAQVKNKTIKDNLERYIKTNVIEEADNEDWITYFNSVGPDAYEEKRGKLTPTESALLQSYFEAKRGCGDKYLSRPKICEASKYVDYDFDDCIDIITHIDDFYMKCQNEKAARKAKAKK